MRQAMGGEPLCPEKTFRNSKSVCGLHEYIIVIWKQVAMVNGVKEVALTSGVNVWQLPSYLGRYLGPWVLR